MEPGTVIIYPGNPGHCCMIIDAAVNAGTDTVFKIVEGYMPAQSIYILSNPYEPEWNPWYHLGKGDIKYRVLYLPYILPEKVRIRDDPEDFRS